MVPEEDPSVLHLGERDEESTPLQKGRGKNKPSEKKNAPILQVTLCSMQKKCFAGCSCSASAENPRDDDFGVHEYLGRVALLFLRSLYTTGMFTGFSSQECVCTSDTAFCTTNSVDVFQCVQLADSFRR